jgi:hypothetical protein
MDDIHHEGEEDTSDEDLDEEEIDDEGGVIHFMEDDDDDDNEDGDNENDDDDEDEMRDEGPLHGPGIRVVRIPRELLRGRGGRGPPHMMEMLMSMLGSPMDMMQHIEDMQMEMAMQASLRENPDYMADGDLSYERLCNLEDVKVTATEDQVSKLRRVKHRCTRTTGEKDETHSRCAVCQDEYENGDEQIQLPCEHRYHEACIINWLKNYHDYCPVCKQKVDGGAEAVEAATH